MSESTQTPAGPAGPPPGPAGTTLRRTGTHRDPQGRTGDPQRQPGTRACHDGVFVPAGRVSGWAVISQLQAERSAARRRVEALARLAEAGR